MATLPPPNNIGESILVEHEDGTKRYYIVADEIVLVTAEGPGRAVCFQRLQHKATGVVQFRFCHYYAADNTHWVFTHQRPYIAEKDFLTIIREAIRKGWIDSTP